MKGCTLSFKTFKYNEAFESGSIGFPSQTNRNTDFVMSSGFHADFFWTCFLNSSIGDHIVWDKCFVHCNNVAFVKNQLLLALTDVHHVCYLRSTIYHASFWAVLFFLLREHTGLRFDSMLKWEAVSPFTVCCNTEVTSVTCGHHVYKEVWDAAIGELPEPASDYREEAKEYDKYAVGPY